MTAPRWAYRLGWRSLRLVVPSLPSVEAQGLARDLGQAMHDHNITTPRRAAMFVAQIAHESGGFQYREEIADGAAYEGRGDLGNTRPGDGHRFKGRGFLQITGRTNYIAVGKALHHDFEMAPQLLAQRAYAATSAAWWWQTHGCSELADRGDFVAVTRRINGGLNGLPDRQAYYRRARLVAAFLVPKRRKP